MALFEGKTPAERNKMIAALVLGGLAFIFVVRLLFFSSGPERASVNNANARTKPAPNARPAAGEAAGDPDAIFIAQPINYNPPGAGVGAGTGRNIFAYYVRPEGTSQPGGQVPTPENVPTPTPVPPPPQTLAGLSPSNVYARTGNFTLQVMGDKFTPETRVYLDGQELQTQFGGPQQLTATVSAAHISAPGMRRVVARTPDNQLYSNEATLNVMQPPAPTYTFVGFIEPQQRGRNERALLKDQKGELYSVQINDLVEGRFRVTAVSNRAVEVMDKDLNIRHVMPFVEQRSTPPTGRGPVGAIPPPPPPPTTSGDEEP